MIRLSTQVFRLYLCWIISVELSRLAWELKAGPFAYSIELNYWFKFFKSTESMQCIKIYSIRIKKKKFLWCNVRHEFCIYQSNESMPRHTKMSLLYSQLDANPVACTFSNYLFVKMYFYLIDLLRWGVGPTVRHTYRFLMCNYGVNTNLILFL